MRSLKLFGSSYTQTAMNINQNLDIKSDKEKQNETSRQSKYGDLTSTPLTIESLSKLFKILGNEK